MSTAPVCDVCHNVIPNTRKSIRAALSIHARFYTVDVCESCIDRPIRDLRDGLKAHPPHLGVWSAEQAEPAADIAGDSDGDRAGT